MKEITEEIEASEEECKDRGPITTSPMTKETILLEGEVQTIDLTTVEEDDIMLESRQCLRLRCSNAPQEFNGWRNPIRKEKVVQQRKIRIEINFEVNFEINPEGHRDASPANSVLMIHKTCQELAHIEGERS